MKKMAGLPPQKSATDTEITKIITENNLLNFATPAQDKLANFKRRTATDEVFDGIYADIMSLTLKPGTKISEADFAKQYNVSRHPIRDAFNRLSNLGLILIRPQRATMVRKISLREVANARFIRMSIELEVAKNACEKHNDAHIKAIEDNMAEQQKTVETGDFQTFQQLDVEFHRLLCLAADCEFAFQAISQTKTQVDRLCTISLSHPEDFSQAYDDHLQIVQHLKDRNVEGICTAMRDHMSRLDTTISESMLHYEDYFTE